jgi:hypothetical protein
VVVNGRLRTSEADQIVGGLEQQLKRGEWTEDVLYGAYAARAIADPKMTLESMTNKKAEIEAARRHARAAADRAADLHKDVRSILVCEQYPVLSWSSEQRSTPAPRTSGNQASPTEAQSASRNSAGSARPGRGSRGRSA